MRKYPYEGLHGDERTHVMEDCGPEPGFDEYMASRSAGINADPTDGFRDGVKTAKRMNPDHYIRPARGCK